MLNIFLYFRYLVFALSIVCSAIIASISVWNLGFAEPQSLSQVVNVDSFVIFVGGSALITTFAIIFIEVGRRNAFTSRIWFDCLWSAVLFLLNLSAAIIVTVLLPSKMCSSSSEISPAQHSTTQLPAGACTSTRVLQAFTWLYAIILLTYFFAVFVTVFIRSGSDHRLWQYSIYNLSSYDQSNNSVRLQSPPSSPIPRMLRIIKPPSIVAPKPQRPVTTLPSLMPYAYRSGLSPDYHIEHFKLPQEQGLQRPPLAAGSGPSNLYPEFLRSSLQSSALPAPPSNRNSSALPGGTDPTHPSDSPPLLGDWPRPDIMQKASRRITPRTVAPAPVPRSGDESDTQPVTGEPSGQLSMAISRSKPFGPRTRAGSISGGNTNAARPPPLDLSNISALTPNRSS